VNCQYIIPLSHSPIYMKNNIVRGFVCRNNHILVMEVKQVFCNTSVFEDLGVRVRVMVFNATVNNISVIS